MKNKRLMDEFFEYISKDHLLNSIYKKKSKKRINHHKKAHKYKNVIKTFSIAFQTSHLRYKNQALNFKAIKYYI